MKELVEFLVRALVDDQQAVSIREVVGADGQPTLEITVAPGEVGRIIGRQGRTVKAIRAVMSAAEKKTGRRMAVQIAGA